MNNMSKDLRYEIARSLVEYASGFDYVDYGEYADSRPDYSGDLEVAAFANWNGAEMGRIAKALEWFGVTIDWSDEYCRCDGCYKFIRTSPNCYSWTLQGVWLECDDILCADCAESEPETVIAEYVGNERKALSLDSASAMLEYAGWRQLNEQSYENGFYGGQADSPQVIAKSLREQGVEDFVFVLDSCGQFDVDFSVWVCAADHEKLHNKRIDSRQAEDPADIMKRGLQNATIQMSQLQGEGIRYAEIHDDGSATAKLVSQQDFIDGNM